MLGTRTLPCWLWLPVLLLLTVAAVPARAQVELVELRVEPSNIGLSGRFRPGVWTPLLLTLTNRSAQSQQVRCEWIIPDSDGDRVQAHRTVTLSPQRTQKVWIYGCPSASTRQTPEWRVRVIDAKSDRLLASQIVKPGLDPIGGDTGVIGLTGPALLGLDAYQDDLAQQEKKTLIQNLNPDQLPDRWQGYAVISALVWTPVGRDPGAPEISTETHQALREWLRRGGHLIIVLSAAGDVWSSSPLRDILPPVTIMPAEPIDKPVWLGLARNPSEELGKIMARALEPQGRVNVLLKDDQHRPIVVTSPYGLGRVTLVGVNIADPRLTASGLPQGSLFWNTVMAWRNPVLSPRFVQTQVQQNKILQPRLRAAPVELGSFVPPMISMRETAGPVLLAAIVIFGIYWLAAGPLGFATLQFRKQVRHAWVVFAVTVAVFTLLTWTVAMAARPNRSRLAHFSVVDIEVATGWVRAQSWASLFVPTHGRVDVAIDPYSLPTTTHSVSSPGLVHRDDATTFLDPKWYTIDSTNPGRVDLPLRATSKMLKLDYLGKSVGRATPDKIEAWGLPTGQVKLVSGWPRGELKHNLPGTLRDVLVIYCPGSRPFELTPADPMVWRYRGEAWKPGQTLVIDDRPPHKPLAMATEPPPLPPEADPSVQPWWGGYLGMLTNAMRVDESTAKAQQDNLSADRTIQAIEMLSFFENLPPPHYTRVDFNNPPWNYRRTIGRELDISHWLSTRCLIIIGYLESSEIPVPLTIEGQTVPSQGWTVVRWICPLD